MAISRPRTSNSTMSSLSDAPPSPSERSIAGPSRVSSTSAPTTRRASARQAQRVEHVHTKRPASLGSATVSAAAAANHDQDPEDAQDDAEADDASVSDMDTEKVDEAVSVAVPDAGAGGGFVGRSGQGEGHAQRQSVVQGQGQDASGQGYLYPYMPHVVQSHTPLVVQQQQQQQSLPQAYSQPGPSTSSHTQNGHPAYSPATSTHAQVQVPHATQHTPQHQLAYMHHAPPPMARPVSVHSQMSLVPEDDDEDFVPIDMSSSASQISTHLSVGHGRPEMQRAHSAGYLQTPYPPHVQAQNQAQMHPSMTTQPHSQGPSPYVQSTPLPMHGSTPHMLVPGNPAQSPTDSMLFHSQQASAQAQLGRPPGMPQRHSTMSAVAGPSNHAPVRPGMQRQYSLQPPPARVNPIGHDVFAAAPGSTPVRRVGGMETGMEYHLALQGISPARALGPAPIKTNAFSFDSALTTPLPKGVTHIPSSVTSTSLSGSSSVGSDTHRIRRRTMSGPDGSSDDDGEDDDSPTRPSRSTSTGAMHMAATPASISSSELSEEGGNYQPKSPVPAPVRLNKPPVVCRTSAKLARTAEDPGVEGIPPGPRPMERPTPSFACIIGQAILHSSAGGLSLEHIYRYVETAYPFFKTGDGAWRNSVRHNLSIHKMFGTIPRTEKFPPGKGGIWVIYEEEKCHWPSEGKFIKNFPASHAHHANCRQTQHEREKEVQAMAKAAAEGKEYIPRKGKKGRKLAAAAMASTPGGEMGMGMGSGQGMEMMRTASGVSMDGPGSVERPMTGGGMMVPLPMQHPHPHAHAHLMPQQQQQQHMSSPAMGTPMMMVPHGHPRPMQHQQLTPIPAHMHPHHPHAQAQAQAQAHAHAQHMHQQQQQQQMMPPPMPHPHHPHMAVQHTPQHQHLQHQHQQHHQAMVPGPLQPMVAQQSTEHVHTYVMPPVPMRPRSAQQPMPVAQARAPLHPLAQQQQPQSQAMLRTSHEDEFRPIPIAPAASAPPAPAPKRTRDSRDAPVEEEENVFTVPKRVRLDESAPQPLAPLSLGQQLPQHLLGQQGIMHVGPNGVLELDDAYVTPERERVGNAKAALSSGAFKTPALVDTSSSPTSSPMPPTLPRAGAGAHNPSSLHQAWTNDDVLTSASPAGSGFSLDAAFDIKPKALRKMDDDALWPPSLTLVDEKDKSKNATSTSPKAPPKTPLTRSSAAIDRDRHQTPRHVHRTPFGSSSVTNSTFKTPMMFAGSPVLPRPLGHEMSTPAWELEGIFDRLTEYKSPSRVSASTGAAGALPLGVRSPLTSTDPSRYATLLSSGDGSPKGKSRVQVQVHDSPFKRRSHGHVRGMGSMGSLSSLGALGDIKGVLLPALKEDKQGEVSRDRVRARAGESGETPNGQDDTVGNEDEGEDDEVEQVKGLVLSMGVQLQAA